jgi:hypothetical protein
MEKMENKEHFPLFHSKSPLRLRLSVSSLRSAANLLPTTEPEEPSFLENSNRASKCPWQDKVYLSDPGAKSSLNSWRLDSIK